jgi:hypothetical protein
MVTRRFLSSFIWIIALAAPRVLVGQGEDSSSGHPTLSIGRGFTTMTGDSAGELNGGGNFQLNGGYFFNRYFGITRKLYVHFWGDQTGCAGNPEPS